MLKFQTPKTETTRNNQIEPKTFFCVEIHCCKEGMQHLKEMTSVMCS